MFPRLVYTRVLRSPLSLVCAFACCLPSLSFADPCGMVPPMVIDVGEPIERIGSQKTYVFFKKGIESIVLRPAFRGKVEQFGMLIPFPSPPAIRKVPDNIFKHIQAAIEPPEISLIPSRPNVLLSVKRVSVLQSGASRSGAQRLAIHAVRVLRQEAVGMYQVAVLQGGSAKAIEKWMKRNRYRYPKGMDKVVGEYVKARWSFVAVKTRVATKSGVSPKPGMRTAKAAFPKGGYFKGAVQAMGFRFRTRKLVVPMRLSAFNKGKLRNIVYLLTDGPQRIRHIDQRFVRRQVSGTALYEHVTHSLPVWVRGNVKRFRYRWRSIRRSRDPLPHNGHARDLFASDLFAVQRNALSLPYEEEKKALLRIGERLLLRGKHLDRLHRDVLKAQRRVARDKALRGLKTMTMTVVDGDFPRRILARENLTFQTYTMPSAQNSKRYYDVRGEKIHPRGRKPRFPNLRRHTGELFAMARTANAVPGSVLRMRAPRSSQGQILSLILAMREPKKVDGALRALSLVGQRALPALWGEVREKQPFVPRGWALVAMHLIKGGQVEKYLHQLARDRRQHTLVRSWAVAALVKRTKDFNGVRRLAWYMRINPSVGRPFEKKLTSLFSGKSGVTLSSLLRIASTNWQMRAVLTKIIASYGAPALIQALLTDKQQRSRSLAAGFVAGLGRHKPKETIRLLLAALRVKANSGRVPWHGGPLFLPSLPWTKVTARQLMSRVIGWMVWADRRGRLAPQKQIDNLLRSWSLSRAAGYRLTNWRWRDPFRLWRGKRGPQRSVNEWLVRYGQMSGCLALKRLLRQQMLLRHHRYQPAIKALRCF